MGMGHNFKFDVDVNVINHLGVGLYSSTPAALTELVANAWDADATEVSIDIDPVAETITIQDDGHGMTPTEIQDRFLKVGYSRRGPKGSNCKSASGKRQVMGRKGIGKLSMFALADELIISSQTTASGPVGFTIDVPVFKKALAEHKLSFLPEFTPPPFPKGHGTKIEMKQVLKGLKTTEGFLRIKLARRFSILGGQGFSLKLNDNPVTKAHRGFYDAVQFLWAFDDASLKEVKPLCTNLASLPVKPKPKELVVFCTETLPNQVTVDKSIFSVSGYIASVAQPKQLGSKDDTANIVSVFANGRVFAEDILHEANSAKYYQNYLVGEIHADFLDADGVDRATASREAIKKDDPTYQALISLIRSSLEEISNKWDTWRTSLGLDEAAPENRAVLERIQQTGRIFWAWADRKWMLAGAAVHVSMVAFERSTEQSGTSHIDSTMWDYLLDGQPVPFINPDLTTGSNAASALQLKENANLCFMGTTKVGPFDIDAETARKMLASPTNPNGRPNSDVVRPWVNATDITRRPRHMYIIDFGTEVTELEAALYEIPFEYIRHHVKPLRKANNRDAYARRWWIHGEARVELRRAMKGVSRYILTSRVSKHRLFTWLPITTLPDSATFAIARDDDYFFGVLHSKIHELWALQMGTQLESRPRYTPDSTFDTFPFPYPPGTEPSEDESPIVKAIADAARSLVKLREAWLNPPDTPQGELKKRTLTNLYNKRPAWLENAHQALDRAVFAAYGLAYPLAPDEIIRHLLALNRERATGHVRVLRPDMPPKKSPGVERLPTQRPLVKVGS
jgi:Histidine kinase-, DNA gyrase B-, and HSP90-like ATPase